MKRLTCAVAGAWSGGPHGSGAVKAEHLTAGLAVPSALGGTGAGTNPEELILAAAASCYLITFAALVERQSLPVVRSEVRSEGVFELEGRLQLIRIVHHVLIRLAPNADAAQLRAVTSTAHRVESICMVARALRQNVPIEVRVEVQQGEPS